MNIGGVHSLLIQGFEEKAYEELHSLGDEILTHTITDLLYDRDHVSSSYIGSNSVVEDRLGSIISMLTTYGIVVEGTRNALHIESLSNTLGSKKPFPLIITPKRVARTRSKIFQRIYELLTAVHTIGDEEKIFFNWNYHQLTRETTMLEETISSRLVGERDPSVREELGNVIREYLDHLIEDIQENIPCENARESFKYLVNLLPRAYNDLFEHIASMKIFTGNRFDDIIDYTTLVIEKNVFEIILRNLLLEKARRENVAVFWVTSNPDDNHISRISHVLSWINDTIVLTYIWRNLDQAVLKAEDIVEEDLDRDYEKTYHPLTSYNYLYIDRHTAEKRSPLGQVMQQSRGGLWYAKFSRFGPIIQLLYLGGYRNDTIEEGLRELFTVSDKRVGYPRPLLLVRRACRISEEVARGLGDSLLRRVGNPLFKAILNKRHSFAEDIL